jgi:membrane protease YdiL (CAAX protease family)
MHLIAWIQHLFAALSILLVPAIAARYERRLKLFTSSERRTTWYRSTVITLWILAFAAVALACPVDIFVLANRASVAMWFGAHRAIFLGTAGLIVAYTSLTLWQGLKAAMNPGLRMRIAKAMQPLRFALPVSVRERRWWILVSISAGVCEEILYRGFAMHYFSGSLSAGIPVGTVGAWLASSLLFGLAHAYQGAEGIIRSTLGGLILGAIAILSGGLLLSIVLHVLFDLQMLWMYRPMTDDPGTAAQLIEGCEPSKL